jgi:hypothetical protein
VSKMANSFFMCCSFSANFLRTQGAPPTNAWGRGPG